MSKRSLGILLLLAGPLAAGILRIMPFDDDPRHSVCTFRRITGLPCATCGMTRSLAALARGEWQRSRAYHPLGGAVALALAAAWAGMCWFWLRNMAVPARLVRWWFLACLGIAAACFVVWLGCVIFPAIQAIWYH